MTNFVWFAVFAVTVAVVRCAPADNPAVAADGRVKKDVENVKEKMNATADANKAADSKSKAASPQSPSYAAGYSNAAAYRPAQYPAPYYVANAWSNWPYQATPYTQMQNQGYYTRNLETMTAGPSKTFATPYTQMQNQGYYLRNLETPTAAQPKTFIHKPSFYQYQQQQQLQQQPQVYAYPVYHPYVQQSYAPQAYSLYPEYAAQYKSVADDATDESIRLVSGEQQIQPMVSYKTQYIVEKPAADKQYAPVDRRRSVPEIVQMYPAPAAAQEVSWSPMAYPSTGYTQMEDLRKSDVVLDDKFNMRISPNYLIDRLRMMPAGNARPTLFTRSTAEEPPSNDYSEFAGQPSGAAPAVDGQDRVYMEMNPYDASQNGKSLMYEGGVMDQQQVAAMAPSKWSLKETKAVPYSRDEIRQAMEQYYSQIYNTQMQNLARTYPREEEQQQKSKAASYEDMLDKITRLNELVKKSLGRSKDNEAPKEMAKDMKPNETKDAESSTKRT